MELYRKSDCSSDCSASEDYFLMFGIISLFIIIKQLVDVDQSLHTRRMVPQVLLV